MRLSRIAAGAAVGAIGPVLLILPAWAASNNVVTTFAGTGQAGYSGDGSQAQSAEVNQPAGMALDAAGDVIFADSGNNRIRKVLANGVIVTVAGTGVAGDSGDGGPATAAQLDHPTGIAVDSAGNAFIADTGNDRIRMVDRSGNITTAAGRSTGPRGDHCDDTRGGDYRSNGHGRPARNADFCHPTGVAVDTNGDLFIADTGHDVVRSIGSDGSIRTVAGTGERGSSGKTGPADHARLNVPTGLAISGSTLLIADTGNHQVLEVHGGAITTFAGTGQRGFAGDGGQASSSQLDRPTGITFDPLGNAYIVDSGNNRLREVTASGVISTLGGTGQPTFSGDGGPAESAAIHPSGPLSGVAADAANVYFADTGNHRGRSVHQGGPPPALPEAPDYANVLLAGSAAAVLGSGATIAGVRRRRHLQRLTSDT